METSGGDIQWRIETFEQADSTNRLAMEKLLALWAAGGDGKISGLAEGLVVIARRQTAGRGQHDRRWESPAGGLYLSAVIETVPAQARGALALVAGLAVAELLRGMEFQSLIRWPNDIVIGGRKVAGILSEAAAQAGRWAAVIGIGINVATEISNLPRALQESATSLRQEFALQAPDGNPERSLVAPSGPGAALTPSDLVQPLLGNFAAIITELNHAGLAPLIRRIRCLDALENRRIRFATAGETFDAVARGIDEHGRLMLERRPGEIQSHSNGSVLGEVLSSEF